jgi:3-methyladenine DNA glycosylase AlkD
MTMVPTASTAAASAGPTAPAAAPVTSATKITSASTARAVAFVAAHRGPAEALGAGLAEHVGDPDGFAAALRSALVRLADPDYLAGQHRVAPNLGLVHGVRWPLLAAVARGFRSASKHDPATSVLFVADRLFREAELEARWFAFGLLERTLPADPERTWQLLRRAAREAGDWITVDSLAHAYGRGIAAEAYRWAELEQLVYSPSRWERRLVGSTIATMSHGNRAGRVPEVVAHALPLLEQLMGDAEPDVQKALSWAYRSIAPIDGTATLAALRHEADLAVAGRDGHRAWVIRDSLAKLADPDAAADLRARLAGIRKRPDAPSTSPAATMAARFGGLPDPINHPEPPIA